VSHVSPFGMFPEAARSIESIAAEIRGEWKGNRARINFLNDRGDSGGVSVPNVECIDQNFSSFANLAIDLLDFSSRDDKMLRSDREYVADFFF